jgi:hypothetical protein
VGVFAIPIINYLLSGQRKISFNANLDSQYYIFPFDVEKWRDIYPINFKSRTLKAALIDVR